MKQRRGNSLAAPPDFYRQVIKIALPICLQQLLNQGAGFVDTLMRYSPTQKYHVFAPGERYIYAKE